MKPVPVKWVAGKDGISHAERRRGTRTACGRRRLHERFAWPSTGRCPACLTALGEVATA